MGGKANTYHCSSTLDSLFYKKTTSNSDPIFTSDSPTCVIPFSRAGNLIVIKAKADSTEGNFILDTGAPGLVLNLTYFRNYATTLSDEDQTSITGTGTAISKTSIKTVSFGSFDFAKADADIISLANIENAKGIKVLGLIGMSFFKNCEMFIDYEKNLIYLHYISKKDSKTYRNEWLQDSTAYNILPIEQTENRIIVKTELAGKKLKLIIDCAAESNIIDSRLPNKVFEQVEISQRILLSGSGNGKVEALYGLLQNFTIGNQVIGNLPVVITNLEKTCFSFGGCVDGVLGFDFLSLHKIGFNFVTNKMFIWK